MLSVFALCLIVTLPLANSMPYEGDQLDIKTNGAVWEEIEHDYIRSDAIPGDIAFQNTTHGWVISQNKSGLHEGIILGTTDSGLSWQLQLYNESMQFTQIEIVGDELWVTAYGGLFHSFDYGTTWDYIFFGVESEIFGSIYFYNETLGWTGSYFGFYRTVDGGNTWNRTSASPYNGRARDIYFITPEEGWVITGFGIYHTDDGCESWEQPHERGGWAFSFVSDSEAWAVGDNMLVHMTDGSTWVEQPIPSGTMGRAPYFTDIQFMDQTHGWIGGGIPQISYTRNGGADWYEQTVSVDTRILALFMFNESLGWATGWGGHIFRTTRANELGEYSWSTSNVTFVYGVTFILIALVAVSIIFLRFRKRPSAVSPAPHLE